MIKANEVTKQMIMDMSNVYGPSGFEDDVLDVVKKYAGDHVEKIEDDSIRNFYLTRKGNTGGKPVVMVDAHNDEVGFIVQAIRPNGTIDFLPLGHWVPCTVPAHKVKIRNAEGKWISAIVASKPPHFSSAAELAAGLNMDDMVLDVGASSREEVENDFKIRIGAPVCPDVVCEYNEMNGVFLGKAFDCRIGCCVEMEVMKRLAGEELGVDVIGTMTSQEEVGGRGIKAAVTTVKPQLAIVLEGCPADDTFSPEYKIQAGIRRGPMLRHIDVSMITHPRFIRFCLDKGAELGIPCQESVRKGGGTNGALIHNANNSVPSVVISVPVRYTHSHHCYTSYEDFEKTVDLVEGVLRSLNADVLAGF